MRGLLILFLGLLAEIAAFAEAGRLIGAAGTVGLVLASSLAGVMLIRSAGAGLAGIARTLGRSMDGLAGAAEAPSLATPAVRLAAGVLLFVPGLMTSTLGLLVLVPPVRALMLRLLGRLAGVSTIRTHTRGPGPSTTVIDGTYTRVDEQAPRRPGQPPSPWT